MFDSTSSPEKDNESEHLHNNPAAYCGYCGAPAWGGRFVKYRLLEDAFAKTAYIHVITRHKCSKCGKSFYSAKLHAVVVKGY